MAYMIWCLIPNGMCYLPFWVALEPPINPWNLWNIHAMQHADPHCKNQATLDLNQLPLPGEGARPSRSQGSWRFPQDHHQSFWSLASTLAIFSIWGFSTTKGSNSVTHNELIRKNETWKYQGCFDHWGYHKLMPGWSDPPPSVSSLPVKDWACTIFVCKESINFVSSGITCRVPVAIVII